MLPQLALPQIEALQLLVESAKYGAHRLVYFEIHADMVAAIAREKRIKKWRRKWKLNLIEDANPYWRDLYEDIL